MKEDASYKWLVTIDRIFMMISLVKIGLYVSGSACALLWCTFLWIFVVVANRNCTILSSNDAYLSLLSLAIASTGLQLSLILPRLLTRTIHFSAFRSFAIFRLVILREAR